MSDFDVVVVGGGPGGYVCAIRAAQLGLRTLCIDAMQNAQGKPVLGGTCLNVGCIPSKALLDSSHHYAFLAHEARSHGIEHDGLRIDVAAMQKRKARVVQTLTQGIPGLFRKAAVEWWPGHGRLLGAGRVEVRAADGSTRVATGRNIVLATGSVPATLSQAPVDGTRVLDSTGALELDSIPKRLGVIGAGVIGLELGSVWRRLGAEVVLLEALDEFLASTDRDIATEAAKLFRRQGLDIRLGARVVGTAVEGDAVTVHYTQADAEASERFDRLVVAVGRRPNTAGLDAGAAGVRIDARGFIEVDAECRTGVDGIYAIGDCVRGPMLAHKASEEGVAVAERIAGQRPQLALEHVPWVIYTWPEIAWTGATEQALQAAGRRIRTGRFPFLASGRARAMGETDGFAKVIADADTDAILGVHVIGANASELIAEAVVAIECEASSEDLARIVHSHPTMAEAIHEAALAVDGRAIHF